MEQNRRRVLWISRHTMAADQLADLVRALGGPVDLVPWTDTVEDVGALRPLVEQSDAVAAVLPPEKLAALLEIAGSRPVLQAVSARTPTGRWVPRLGGPPEREFAFVHRGWQQILDLRIRVRPL